MNSIIIGLIISQLSLIATCILQYKRLNRLTDSLDWLKRDQLRQSRTIDVLSGSVHECILIRNKLSNNLDKPVKKKSRKKGSKLVLDTIPNQDKS